MSKTIKLIKYELPIVIKEAEEGGFTATSPIWSDCYAEAETQEKVIQEITKVANTLISIYQEEGLKIPLKTISPKKSTIVKDSFIFPLILNTT